MRKPDQTRTSQCSEHRSSRNPDEDARAPNHRVLHLHRTLPRHSSQACRKADHLEWPATKLLLQRRHGRGNGTRGVRNRPPLLLLLLLLLLLRAPLFLLLVLSYGGIAGRFDEDRLPINEGRTAAEDFEHVDNRVQLCVDCWSYTKARRGHGGISAQDTKRIGVVRTVERLSDECIGDKGQTRLKKGRPCH